MMDEVRLLSIIIPVYNVERYIRKCLSSILIQVKESNSMDKVELIIVNDGSQDCSMQIVEEFACKYNFISLIEQENKGLSAARNSGLSAAIGKYVWFFDSDDYLKDNSLARILDFLADGYDLYAVGMEHVDEKENVLCDYLFPKVKVPLEFLCENVFMAQLYIIRRAILCGNSIRFYEGIMHEDMEFTPRMLSFVRTFKVLDFVSYCYLKRTGSITMGDGDQYNIKRAYDIFKIIESLNTFGNTLCASWKKRYSCIISLAMNNILQEEYRFCQKEKGEVDELFYKNRKYFVHLILSFNPKYMIEGGLFILMPKHIVSIFRLLKCKKRHRYE